MSSGYPQWDILSTIFGTLQNQAPQLRRLVLRHVAWVGSEKNWDMLCQVMEVLGEVKDWMTEISTLDIDHLVKNLQLLSS